MSEPYYIVRRFFCQAFVLDKYLTNKTDDRITEKSGATPQRKQRCNEAHTSRAKALSEFVSSRVGRLPFRGCDSVRAASCGLHGGVLHSVSQDLFVLGAGDVSDPHVRRNSRIPPILQPSVVQTGPRCRSSCWPFWRKLRRKKACCGGRRTIACTIASPIEPEDIHSPASADSGGRTSVG